MAKLSEIFKEQSFDLSANRYSQEEWNELQACIKGSEVTLDNLVLKIAIDFAKWLQENRWFNYDKKTKKYCYTFEGGTSMSKVSYEKNYMKTPEELFQEFLKDYKG